MDHIVGLVTPASLKVPLRLEFMLGRKLDKGNPNPGNIGADFNRLGIDFWDTLIASDVKNRDRQKSLEELNTWRNAIAHQDFDPHLLGSSRLRLAKVRQWRTTCLDLADAFDEVMRLHLTALTGAAPW